MNATELIEKQGLIHNLITRIAEDNNLSNPDLKPVYDGVYNVNAYVNSNPRIMWILKEPYDDFDNNGAYGGGWELYSALDNNDAWTNRTWQPMTYVTYGIHNRIHWQDMNWIRDDPSMIDCLKKVVLLNLSKIPNRTTSDDGYVQEQYNLYWKTIVLQQIEDYNPDVIIFGNTFYMMRDDLDIQNSKIERVENASKPFMNIIDCEKKLLIDAYHPNQKTITRELYVNSIIDAVLTRFEK